MKKIIKTGSGIMFVLFFLIFFISINIRGTINSEFYTEIIAKKNLDAVAYEYFISLFIRDYADELKSIMSEQEISDLFKNAFPQEEFRKQVIFKLNTSIVNYIKGKADDIERPSLHFEYYKNYLTGFLRKKAEEVVSPLEKEKLVKIAEEIERMPDELSESVNPVISRDDMEHIYEMRGRYHNMWKSILTSGLLFIFFLIVVCASGIRTLGISAISAGISGVILGFIIVKTSPLIGQNVFPFISYNPLISNTVKEAVSVSAYKTGINLIIESLVTGVTGGIMLILRRRKG